MLVKLSAINFHLHHPLRNTTINFEDVRVELALAPKLRLAPGRQLMGDPFDAPKLKQ